MTIVRSPSKMRKVGDRRRAANRTTRFPAAFASGTMGFGLGLYLTSRDLPVAVVYTPITLCPKMQPCKSGSPSDVPVLDGFR
jgi:hypothetical protein